MRKNLSLLFLGAVLVIFGVVWGGSRVGLLPFDVFFDGWWSLILIVIAVYGMLSHGVKVFDVILLILGVVFLLTGLDVIDMKRFKVLFWPAVLVLIGLMTIFGVFRRGPVSGIESAADAGVRAFFSSSRRKSEGRVYGGGRVESLFGAAELDLRDAVIEGDIVVDVRAAFGSARVLFPPHVRVETEKNAFLGVVTDGTSARDAVNAPAARVRCRAFCGEITLK